MTDTKPRPEEGAKQVEDGDLDGVVGGLIIQVPQTEGSRDQSAG